MLTEEEIDAEIQRLQEKEQELMNGNSRLGNQMNDLRELMKRVDNRYDNDARQLINRNKDLEQEIQSLEQALKISEKHGHHMDSVAQFFNDNEDDEKK
ncbi:UNKNOWN [Stylonychia lemnae]|uniref:Uncharacterized protein n=1 Tax=Stylonychia lemnae TaxID=5949 RepID=A0A078AFV6_STYLE|nr:UNKNOWN [Stylonychia lemnae]|eukprot:CDW81160.1 UNKNOWN [Stylonychia lemnae]